MALKAPLLSTVKAQRSKNKRKTKPKVPLYPLGPEREYMRELVEMVNYIRMLINTRLMPRLVPLQAAVAGARADGLAEDLDVVISGIRFSVARRYPANRRQRMALEAAVKTENFNKAQMTTKVLVPNNLPIPKAEPWLADYTETFAFLNTRLIESIPDQYLDRVQALVADGVISGTSTASIAGEIREQFGVSRRRAQFIARDQISKLNGQLNRTRQEQAGINDYIWRTSGDDSVRPTHAAHEGERFSWSSPPANTGHPGEDYNCRCWAEPVIVEEDDES